jgi:hypothetical protein
MQEIRAHSSAWLERFADNEEVGGSSPPGPTHGVENLARIGSVMKKLLSLALLAVAGYVIYQQAENSKAEQELWTQATSE